MAQRAGNKIALLLLALLFLAAIFVWRLSEDPQFISQFIGSANLVGTTITIHSSRISVSVADTEAERVQGLSGVKSLPDGTGLLMKFDTDGSPGIWMKDMLFPIDIVWIDSNWKVLQVTPSVSPNSYPKVFYPDSNIRYVLELPAGYSDIHNIEAGNTVEH